MHSELLGVVAQMEDLLALATDDPGRVATAAREAVRDEGEAEVLVLLPEPVVAHRRDVGKAPLGLVAAVQRRL